MTIVSILHIFLVDADVRARNPDMKLWSLFDKIHARLIKQAQLDDTNAVQMAYDFVMSKTNEELIEILYENFNNEKGVMALKQDNGIVIANYREFLSGRWDKVRIAPANSTSFTNK
jgi:hypothetical protein